MSTTHPLFYLAVTREFFYAVKPKFVVLSFFEGNDLAQLVDVEVRGANSRLRAYLDPNFAQGLVTARDAIQIAASRKVEQWWPAIEAAKRPQVEWTSLWRLRQLRQAMASVAEFKTARYDDGDIRKGLDLLRVILMQMKAEVEDRGGAQLLFYTFRSRGGFAAAFQP